MLPHNLLPQKQGNVWINPTNESPVAELDLPAMQLTLSINDLEARTKVDASHCHVTSTQISGCYNCETGAVVNITCTTDFGFAVGIAQRDTDNIIFPLHCNDRPTAESVKLNLKGHRPRLSCELNCPASTVKFWIKGELDSLDFNEILHSIKVQNVQLGRNVSSVWEFLAASASFSKNFK